MKRSNKIIRDVQGPRPTQSSSADQAQNEGWSPDYGSIRFQGVVNRYPDDIVLQSCPFLPGDLRQKEATMYSVNLIFCVSIQQTFFLEEESSLSL